MQQSRARRPSPALVVALIALFVALGGSVYAAVKIDGKNVKKGSLPGNRIKPNSVGGKQVNEALLGTVPSAVSATTATTAETAANAAFAAEAASADEADTLNGFSSTAFSRIASDGSGDDAIGFGHAGGGTAAEATIVAPRSGFLLSIASAAVQTTTDDNDAYNCILNVDSTDLGISRRGGETDDPRISFDEEVCATNASVSVQPGPHTVTFDFSGLAATTIVDEASLDVLFIPLAG